MSSEDTPVDMPKRRKSDRDKEYTKWDKRLRDLAVFLLGCAGVVNELWIQKEPRLYALLFIATMLGLPFVLSASEKSRDNK